MHSRPHRITILAAGFAAVVAMMPTLALAGDTANCSEYGYVHRWEGYKTDNWSGHRWGIRTVFDQQTLHQCTNPRVGEGSASTAWVNIVGPAGLYNEDIIQVGMGVCRAPSSGCTLTMQDIWTYGVDPTSPGCSGWMEVQPTGHYLGTWSGGTLYQITYNNGAWHLTAGNGTVHQDVGNGQICWTPLYAAIWNESWDIGDALGGTYADLFGSDQMAFQAVAAGSWITLAPSVCNILDSHTFFYCTGNYPVPKTNTWTNR